LSKKVIRSKLEPISFVHCEGAPSINAFKNRLDDFLADVDNWKTASCVYHWLCFTD